MRVHLRSAILSSPLPQTTLHALDFACGAARLASERFSRLAVLCAVDTGSGPASRSSISAASASGSASASRFATLDLCGL